MTKTAMRTAVQYNIMRKVYLCIFFALSAICARADLGWHSVYQHDSSGTATSGSLAALVAAIDAGADVKLLVLDSSGNVTDVVIPYIVSVNIPTGIVSARYRAVSLETLSDGNTRVATSAYDIDAVVNSTGYVSYSRYSKSGSKISDSTYSWSVRWMVNY